MPKEREVLTREKPIDHDDGIGNLEAGGAERSGGLEDGGAAGDQVFDDEADLTRLKCTLDGLGSAVLLDLLAAHEHRHIVGRGEAGSNWKGSVGDAADKVVGGGARYNGGEGTGNLAEKCRVRDNEAEVDVDGGRDAGFQPEIAELDGGDVVELQN